MKRRRKTVPLVAFLSALPGDMNVIIKMIPELQLTVVYEMMKKLVFI